MAKTRMTRREFLLGSALAAGASAVAGCGSAGAGPTASATTPWWPADITPQTPAGRTSATPPTAGTRQPVLRIAHLTDMHVLPFGPSKDGLGRALRHAQARDPQPQVVFNTGDCVMDSLEADKDTALAQWQAFRDVFEAGCSLPVRHCIGNHDVWGWAAGGAAPADDPLYGKGMAVDQLGLPSRFYSFDQAGWHFLVLDSTHPPILAATDIPYAGKLDDAQFDWLEQELQQTPAEQPIALLSHIPILCACEFFDGPNEDSGNWVVPGAWMHIDARRMRGLFLAHPNVRLCLSGHAHQHDRVDYLGVKYVCSGAVSGNWWNGVYLDFPPAYVVVDLYDDGTSEHTFVPYDSV
jgi:3',5'-cyclic-AMP phosphodiesterase